MTEPIRYGIIGTGMMGCEHILNLARIPAARVTAIADSHETSRGWGRSLAGEPVAVYADYRDLLRDAPVDAVVVATPNFTHFDVLQDVFRTHKHVLVEKPLCTDIEQAHPGLQARKEEPARHFRRPSRVTSDDRRGVAELILGGGSSARHRDPKVSRAHSGLTPASRTTLRQTSISFLILARNCSGVPPAGVEPSV